jgi:parallel beta-helix repeat protein
VAIALGSANPVGGSYNIFAGNTVEGASLWGILLGRGDYNVFYGNLIENNGGLGHDGYGLAIGGYHREVNNNLFYQNIFTNNSKNFATNWEVTGSNFFDNGTMGNYWDDYLTQYPTAIQVGSSGTGNIPYPVYDNINDNHPLINKPNTSTEISSLPNTWSSIDLSSLNVTIPAISTSSFEIPTPTPSVPEFSWLTILPIILTIPIALAIVRKRLQGNV